jgi:hypothetical protein
MPDIVTGSMSGIVVFNEMGRRVRVSSRLFECHDQIGKRVQG